MHWTWFIAFFLGLSVFPCVTIPNYRPPTKLRESNVFTGVCHFMWGWVCSREGWYVRYGYSPSIHGTWTTTDTENNGRYASYWNSFLWLCTGPRQGGETTILSVTTVLDSMYILHCVHEKVNLGQFTIKFDPSNLRVRKLQSYKPTNYKMAV